MAYRWIVLLYFAGWLLASWIEVTGPSYLTYLNTWSFIMFNAYLVIAAISTTTSYLSAHFLYPRAKQEFSREDEFVSRNKPCGYRDNTISKYQMLHWFFFIIGTESAFVVSFLYWILLYRGGHIDGLTVNTHLLNSLVATIDLWVSGIPVNIPHSIYPMLFGSLYAVFHRIYYAASGILVYNMLQNYRESLGPSIAVVLVLILLLLPVVHIVCFYLQYQAKCKIVHCFLQRKRQGKQESSQESV